LQSLMRPESYGVSGVGETGVKTHPDTRHPTAKELTAKSYELPDPHGFVPYNGTTLTVTEDPFTVTVV